MRGGKIFWFPRSCVVTHIEQGNIHVVEHGTFSLSSVGIHGEGGKLMIQEQIIIYQAEDGQAQIDIRFEQETVWLSLAQMVDLFGRDQSVVCRFFTA